MFDAKSLRLKAVSQSRKIIHVDMDSFFASVEMRDHPQWRNIPLAVGGPPGKRGVLSTCNYQARKFGIRSAMPSSHAIRLCPELLIVPGRMSVYKEASIKVHEVFKKYTNQIEPISLDEAYLDVTDSIFFNGSATLLANQIPKEIQETTGLTASAGVAPNKFLAKMASEWNKPNGQFTITPNQIDSFISALPLSKLPGIGAKTAISLERKGFKSCSDIQKADLFTLRRKLGNYAHRLYELSFGFDDHDVITHWQRKSLGVEETFEQDLNCEEGLLQIDDLHQELSRRFNKYLLKETNALSHKAFVKIKTYDFKQHTLEKILTEDLKEVPSLADYSTMLSELLDKFSTSIRLIGLGVRLSYDDGPKQLDIDYNQAI